MFCIYKTDPDWIKVLRTIPTDTQVNFWRRGTNDLKLPIGSWVYFNQRRTRNIIGRGVLIDYGIHAINRAWELYGVGNGVRNLEELKQRAADVLGVKSDDAEIGCIILSELEFLPNGFFYSVSETEYSKSIVGPKYFQDTELPDLHELFTAQTASVEFQVEEESMEYMEGDLSFSYRKGYERNLEARKRCLEHHGFRCLSCELLMEERYGIAAREFIHVHHNSLISSSGGTYLVDPVRDLSPLCPNCHAIAHRRVPPFSIEELRNMLRGKGNG